MYGLSNNAVDFFSIVINSGLIAVAALAVSSVIAFAAVLVLFREPSAEPSRTRAGSAAEVRPRGEILAATMCTADTPKAVAG